MYGSNVTESFSYKNLTIIKLNRKTLLKFILVFLMSTVLCDMLNKNW